MKIREVASHDIITELSNELLGRYKTAAGKSARQADQSGNFSKGNKRFSGIVRATKKQFNNDSKKHVMKENPKQSDFDMGYEDAVSDELDGWISDDALSISSVVSIAQNHRGGTPEYWDGYMSALKNEFHYPD